MSFNPKVSFEEFWTIFVASSREAVEKNLSNSKKILRKIEHNPEKYPHTGVFYFLALSLGLDKLNLLIKRTEGFDAWKSLELPNQISSLNLKDLQRMEMIKYSQATYLALKAKLEKEYNEKVSFAFQEQLLNSEKKTTLPNLLPKQNDTQWTIAEITEEKQSEIDPFSIIEEADLGCLPDDGLPLDEETIQICKYDPSLEDQNQTLKSLVGYLNSMNANINFLYEQMVYHRILPFYQTIVSPFLLKKSDYVDQFNKAATDLEKNLDWKGNLLMLQSKNLLSTAAVLKLGSNASHIEINFLLKNLSGKVEIFEATINDLHNHRTLNAKLIQLERQLIFFSRCFPHLEIERAGIICPHCLPIPIHEVLRVNPLLQNIKKMLQNKTLIVKNIGRRRGLNEYC